MTVNQIPLKYSLFQSSFPQSIGKWQPRLTFLRTVLCHSATRVFICKQSRIRQNSEWPSPASVFPVICLLVWEYGSVWQRDVSFGNQCWWLWQILLPILMPWKLNVHFFPPRLEYKRLELWHWDFYLTSQLMLRLTLFFSHWMMGGK